MGLLYAILKNFFTWVVPVLIVIFSIVFVAIDAPSFKSSFQSNNFYSQFVEKLNNTDDSENIENQGVAGLVATTLGEDLITEVWTQEVVEKNIDLTTSWLKGEDEFWVFYLPTKEIEDSLKSRVDSQVNEALASGKEIRTCSVSESQTIQREGFEVGSDFCLPQSVKNGEETLSGFLESGSGGQNDGLLNQIFKNLPIDSTAENFKAEVVGQGDNGFSLIVNTMNIFRDSGIFIRSSFWIVAPIILLSFVGLLFLAKVQGVFLAEIRRIFWLVGFGTLLLSFTVVMVLSGSFYINTWIVDVLLPGFTTVEIMNLVAWQFVLLSFNLVSLAVWASVILIVLGTFVYILERVLPKKDSSSDLSEKTKNNFDSYKNEPHLVNGGSVGFEGQDRINYGSNLDQNPEDYKGFDYQAKNNSGQEKVFDGYDDGKDIEDYSFSQPQNQEIKDSRYDDYQSEKGYYYEKMSNNPVLNDYDEVETKKFDDSENNDNNTKPKMPGF
jgi:hypothetical protein